MSVNTLGARAIIFAGGVRFSQRCLKVLLDMGAPVVGVLALRPGAVSSGADYADISGQAAAAGIPVHHFERISDPEVGTFLDRIRPDVGFVFGLSQLLPRALLEKCNLGWIGTHPALLPRNRGRHPLIWAIIEGLTESGLTFFRLDEGADSGDIVWQGKFEILGTDDASTLYRKMEDLAAEGLHKWVPLLLEGRASFVPQDHAQATYWRKRKAADGQIRWREAAQTACRLIRALTRPYPGAETYLHGRRVTVWRARETTITESERGPSGQVCRVEDGGPVVICGRGAIQLIEWQSQEGMVQPMVGDRFGEGPERE